MMSSSSTYCICRLGRDDGIPVLGECRGVAKLGQWGCVKRLWKRTTALTLFPFAESKVISAAVDVIANAEAVLTHPKDIMAMNTTVDIVGGSPFGQWLNGSRTFRFDIYAYTDPSARPAGPGGCKNGSTTPRTPPGFVCCRWGMGRGGAAAAMGVVGFLACACTPARVLYGSSPPAPRAFGVRRMCLDSRRARLHQGGEMRPFWLYTRLCESRLAGKAGGAQTAHDRGAGNGASMFRSDPHMCYVLLEIQVPYVLLNSEAACSALWYKFIFDQHCRLWLVTVVLPSFGLLRQLSLL